ncbi:hypothetical protein HF521_010020 [Silurus meridionalis]|uniref:Ig-like domain-containing protein n=2 Tax=Silurus meridionalis TaxID=175797 RepID=A0A8T0ALW7_SILME|nr:hypothetical protein HF521_010020 [Silurus meridionalis]
MSLYSLQVVALFGIFLCVSDVESMRTLTNVAVNYGGSVTIPCLYDQQYKANPKFWCKGYHWATCSIVAYANTNGSTSVIDHPAHNMFTVDLNPVFESGSYWCAAEIGGPGIMDDSVYLYLTVSQNPDLSVRESRVRGEEGGSITVECLYSSAYQNENKQWCRFPGMSCNSVERTETSQNSAVVISDDGKRSFTVKMSGLKKSDAGWYWCSAGDLQVPVHISVGAEAPGLPSHRLQNNGSPSDYTILALCISSGILFVLMVVGAIVWRLQKKRTGISVTDKGCAKSLASSASEPEVTYTAVRLSHHPTGGEVSPVSCDDPVIYSSVTQ